MSKTVGPSVSSLERTAKESAKERVLLGPGSLRDRHPALPLPQRSWIGLLGTIRESSVGDE